MENIHKDIDFKEGYELSKENFLKHLLVADNCETISYGIATSHLILAAEEAVKAFLLLRLTIDKESIRDVKLEDFDSYFSKHRFKHEVIRQMEIFGTLIDTSHQIRLKPFEDIKSGTASKKDIIEKRDQGVENLIQWLNDLNDGKESLGVNEDWWKQADSNKNKGFYINLLKKTGKWDGPHLIKESFYLQSKDIVRNFIERVLVIEEAFNNEEVKNMYFEMITKLKNKPDE